MGFIYFTPITRRVPTHLHHFRRQASTKIRVGRGSAAAQGPLPVRKKLSKIINTVKGEKINTPWVLFHLRESVMSWKKLKINHHLCSCTRKLTKGSKGENIRYLIWKRCQMWERINYLAGVSRKKNSFQVRCIYSG